MAAINTWPGWECVRKLGSGGFGTVYEIKRVENGKEFHSALKVLTIPKDETDVDSIISMGMDEQSATAYFRGMVDDLTREIRLMADLKGLTNIVSYEDHKVIRHEDSIGWDILIRMELLTPFLKYQAAHPIFEKDIVAMGCDLCKALEICQSQGIIHRDIKPGNIFVNHFGDYVLGDFGVARTMEKTTGASTRTGTNSYMAPEVFNGKERYDARADIYSLGIVLYQYLNKARLPFCPLPPEPIKGSDFVKAQVKRLTGKPVPRPYYGSDRLAAAVLKAIAYDPEDRFATAAEFHKELKDCALFTSDGAAIAGCIDSFPLRPGARSEEISADEDKPKTDPVKERQETPPPEDKPEPADTDDATVRGNLTPKKEQPKPDAAEKREEPPTEVGTDDATVRGNLTPKKEQPEPDAEEKREEPPAGVGTDDKTVYGNPNPKQEKQATAPAESPAEFKTYFETVYSNPTSESKSSETDTPTVRAHKDEPASSMTDTAAPCLSMKYYKFVIYVLLFVGALKRLYDSVHFTTGLTYGLDSAKSLYADCGWLRWADVAIGLGCMVLAVSAILIRQQLKHFKKNAHWNYIMLLAGGLIIEVIQLIVLRILRTADIVLVKSIAGIMLVGAKRIAFFLVYVLVIALSYLYFRKREQLFDGTHETAAKDVFSAFIERYQKQICVGFGVIFLALVIGTSFFYRSNPAQSEGETDNVETSTQTETVEQEDTTEAVSEAEVKADAESITAGETTEVAFVVGDYTYRSDDDLTWSSSDNSIASVDSNGVVRGFSAGTVTITGEMDGHEASVQIEILTASEESSDSKTAVDTESNSGTALGELDEDDTLSISLNPTEILVGDSVQKWISTDDWVMAGSSAGIEWSTDDSSVATVEDGVVTGVSAGTCNVIATYGGKTAEREITVAEVDKSSGASISADYEVLNWSKGTEGTITLTFNNVPDQFGAIAYSNVTGDSILSTEWGEQDGDSVPLTINTYTVASGEYVITVIVYDQNEPEHVAASKEINLRIN